MFEPEDLLPEQQQLDMLEELYEGVPWSGRSPRALTAGYKRVILKTQGEKSVSDFVDPDQYDLFDTRQKKAPVEVRTGAPSLLPLPWEVRDGT